MGFLNPELLLLALPIGLVWWKTRSSDTAVQVLRAVVAALLVLALASPYLATRSVGRDLVVVVDRSRSMPPGSDDSAVELIRLAEDRRREGDRVAVIGFGGDVSVERLPGETARFQGFEREPDADGSDLGAALGAALELIPGERQGAILLLSDGENNGRDPLAAARRAFGRSVRIDVRDATRPAVPDLSVERFDLPAEVAVGEPFQFHVWVRADRRTESEFRLRRGTTLLSSGRRVFERGMNRVTFRDVLEVGGIAEYAVELDASEDRVPQNNVGSGAVMAAGALAVLVLNDDGTPDSLVQALRGARLPVAVSTPEAARLDVVGLSAFRAVVLENVAASRLGPGMEALRDFVLERGGGLLMTGGKASFGVGGYYLSPLDDVLPVSMELRQEHRKLSVALAIAMDRSGSMAVPVGGGVTKMDLANLGAVAALELLSVQDAIAIIAVDSAPHVVQELTPVDDIAALAARVRTIRSEGGGIFTYSALLAAGKELERAGQANRHIILFADAADSEEQEHCPELIDRFGEMGITLSVIALGTKADSDAAFLEAIAKQGGGEVYFTQDPAELPRLFALDTMTAARSTFIEEPTPVALLPGLLGMASLGTDSFPEIAGYNLPSLRPAAQAGAATRDDYRAPVFAFMHHGLGRSAAYAGQLGGTFGRDVVGWDHFATFFVTAVRWLLGSEEPEEFFASVRRQGQDALITVELDRDATLAPDTAELTARLLRADGSKAEVPLVRTGEATFEARYPLEKEGILVGSVLLGDERFLSLPPVTLPYSPEFERSSDPERGARLLRSIARESGGEVGATADSFFRGERVGRSWRVISRELLLAALVLLLVEIAGRRLSLFGSLRLPRLRRLLPRRAEGATVRPASGDVRPAAPGAPAPESPAPGAAPPASEPALGSALSRARRAADRRLGRGPRS